MSNETARMKLRSKLPIHGRYEPMMPSPRIMLVTILIHFITETYYVELTDLHCTVV
jgi:hypothetical protein